MNKNNNKPSNKFAEEDDKLDIISNNLTNVKNIATNMNSAISSHEPLISNLKGNIENTTNNIATKNQNLDRVNEDIRECCGKMVYYVIIAILMVLNILVCLSFAY